MVQDSLKGDIYLLARNAPESARLVEQHRMVTELYGQLIHPTIMPGLPPKSRVADIACGTGVWALHAAQILPEAELLAFDISSAQFPSHKPDGNVSFEMADAKQPFPKSYHGTFDLVHIRALFAAMHPPDWEFVMRNIVQLLKPGGAVQWEEADNTGRCLRGSKEFQSYNGIPLVLAKFGEVMGDRRSDMARHLPAAASSTGLVDIEVDVSSTDRIPEFRVAMTKQYMIGITGWAEKAAIWKPEQLNRIKKDVADDIERGAYCRLDTITVVGRKP